MISKVLGLALLVACSQALQNDHQHTPTSFASFNDNHNTVHHIQSAPQHYSSPNYAPSLLHSAAPAPVQYAAPSFPKYAAPSLPKYAAPSLSSQQAGSYFSSNLSPSNQYSAASVQRVAQFAPVSHQAAPIRQQLAPSHQAYSSLNLSPSQYAAPAVQQSVQFAPISHQVAPVAHRVAAPSYAHAAPAHQEEQYAPAQYTFSYGVQDHHTGDIHSHQETRNGDHTQGEYSLHEADGTIRTVRYNVEGHSGFNAVVERSGHAQTQTQAHQPIKALVAAPHQQYSH